MKQLSYFWPIVLTIVFTIAATKIRADIVRGENNPINAMTMLGFVIASALPSIYCARRHNANVKRASKLLDQARFAKTHGDSVAAYTILETIESSARLDASVITRALMEAAYRQHSEGSLGSRNALVTRAIEFAYEHGGDPKLILDPGYAAVVKSSVLDNKKRLLEMTDAPWIRTLLEAHMK